MNPRLALFRVSEFRNAFVLRGVLVWGALRLAAFVGPFGPLTLFGRLLLLVLVGVTVWIDAGRRGEIRFLANLGISSWAVILAAVAVPLVAEPFIP